MLERLNPGQSFLWRVFATAAEITSQWARFRTASAVPMAPIVLRSRVTDTGICAFFSTPQDHGSPINKFEAAIDKFGGDHEVQALGADADHVTFVDLEPGTTCKRKISLCLTSDFPAGLSVILVRSYYLTDTTTENGCLRKTQTLPRSDRRLPSR